MRNTLVIIAAITVVALFAQTNNAYATPYTFDANNESWSNGEVTYADYFETITITLESAAWATEAGDNGYIEETATSSTRPRPYNLGLYREHTTSASLLGNLTAKSIQADFMRLGADFTTLAGSDATIRLVISDATPSTSGYQEATWYYSNLSVSPVLNNLTGTWTTKEFEMSADNFFLWPNGITDGTELSFDNLIADNYNFFGFTILSSAADGSDFGRDSNYDLPDYGAYSSGTNSTLGIDNVSAVPEPTTLALLVLAGLGVTCRRQK